jgi:hypothetical protein
MRIVLYGRSNSNGTMRGVGIVRGAKRQYFVMDRCGDLGLIRAHMLSGAETYGFFFYRRFEIKEKI